MQDLPSAGGSTSREPRATTATQTSRSPDSLIGQTLSHYHILEMIGSGYQGNVYRARDTLLARDVAVKVVAPERCTDLDRVRRFRHEVQAAASINHPNVCTILDVGTHGDSPFVVMELLRGETIRERLLSGPVPVHRALNLVAQAARGLAAAHGKGIVHRDLKPANIFVTKAGQVKLLDFGLAKLARGEEWRRQNELLDTSPTAEVNLVVGTMGYMAPEQARGETADSRSDLFALGAILYELLTGKRAFSGRTYAEALGATLMKDPGPISAAGVPVPPSLELVVRRCLEKNPDERFQSAGDLAFGLDCLAGSGLPAAEEKPKLAVRTRRRLARVLAVAAVGSLGLALGRLSVPGPPVDLQRYRLWPFVTQLQAAYRPHWSPDGKSIAFIGLTEEAGAQVYVQGLQTSAPVQLTRRPFEWDFQYAWLAWTPDARSIYCPGTMGKDRGIFMIPVGGGNPILIQRDATAGALSPDGRTLVMLARSPSNGEWRVWHASPPDAPRQLYEPPPLSTASVYDTPSTEFLPDGRAICLQLTATEGFRSLLLPWPPDESREAPDWMVGSPIPGTRYAVHARTDNKLYMVDTQNGKLWPIFMWTRPIWGPAVSPDGRHIAFPSNESHTDVIQVPIDGSPPRALLGSLSNEDMPSLCMEGRELVYVSNRGGTRGSVWMHDMRTGTDREILNTDAIPARPGEVASMFMNPALSPDCRRLAVAAVTGLAETKIFLVHRYGGTPVRATSETDGIENAPTWSPDGERIAYLHADTTGWSLMLTRVGEASPPVELASHLGDLTEGAGIQMPEWSPRGDWIAVSDSARLILVDPGGRRTRYLQSAPGPLAWARDGRTLYVIRTQGRHGSLVAINPDTGAERVVRDLGEFVPWGFEYPGNRVSVTRDGKSLIYRVLKTRSEIWMLDGVHAPRPWYAWIPPGSKQIQP